MRKTALNVGSSKHGKAERAFVASNWVVARYLETQIAQMKKTMFGLFDTFNFYGGASNYTRR